MNSIAEAAAQAFRLIVAADPNVVRIALLSLKISLASVTMACILGLPLGAAIAVNEFPGKRLVVVLLNGLMGLPPVVVGLFVYLMLSRAGPLGTFGILFTPTAMVVAQTILIAPIIAALSRQVVADAWLEYREQLRSLGETKLGAAATLALGPALFPRNDRAGWFRSCGIGSRRSHHRRRQHRRCHASDDHDHRPGDQQGRPAAWPSGWASSC